MAFQNHCGDFYGIYPCPDMEVYQHTIKTQDLPNNAFSKKAKSFTIDALLSADKQDRKPVLSKQMVTSHTAPEQQKTTGKKMFESGNCFTPKKPETTDSTQSDLKTEENYSGYYQADMQYGNHIQSNLPLKIENVSNFTSSNYMSNRYPSTEETTFYSPMMTGWFFRSNECYSPMTGQSHSTPIGLKSVYQTSLSIEKVQNQSANSSYSTPDSKNSSMFSDKFFTPTGRSTISSVGGRKIMSSGSRRHDRPHPYLLSRHQIKSELESPSTQELEKVEVATQKSVKNKRQRTAFTPHQLQVLESEFEKQQYLVGEERCVLAESLDLTVTQVKVWFQNRRIKWRKEQFEQGKIQQ